MEQKDRIIQIDNVGPGVSKKKKRGRLLTLTAVLIIIAAAFMIFRGTTRAEMTAVKSYTLSEVRSGTLVSTTEASGTVILPTQVTIVSTEDCYADELLVEEGDTISKTDILAILDVPDLEDERDELTVSLAQAEIELESIELEYDYQIAEIKLSLERLEENITEAEEDLAALKILSELSSSREADYEDAADELEDLLDLKEDYQISLAETVSMKDISLRKQQAALEQVQVSLANILDDIEETRVKSPIAGEVLSINEDLAIPGSSIESTDSLFIVADRTNSFIDFDVYEQYTDQLETGGEMTVTIGTDTMKAEIVRIGKIAEMDSDGLSAMITVRAKPDTELTLTPGASAVASITLGVQEDVLLLPRGSYLTTGSQKWVYKVDGSRAYKTEVTYGSIEGTEVEILKGLKTGDEIISSSYQNFIDEDVIELK